MHVLSEREGTGGYVSALGQQVKHTLFVPLSFSLSLPLSLFLPPRQRVYFRMSAVNDTLETHLDFICLSFFPPEKGKRALPSIINLNVPLQTTCVSFEIFGLV